MDSWCTGPASIITKNVYNAKNQVVTTQEGTVLDFRSDVGPPPNSGGVRHAGHTRARSRCQHGFPSAPQRVPGCQHVALPLLAVEMQRLSRHRRLTTRQTRASERCFRPPGRRPKVLCEKTDANAATVACRGPPSSPPATKSCHMHS